MSKHGNRPGALRISGNGSYPGGAKVELDGEEITDALAGLSLRLAVDHQPTATLDVVLWDVSSELDCPRYTVPDKTRDVLVRLGWTPPAEEPAGGENR